MARKTKLNDQTQTALVKLLERGVTVKDACAAVGIDEKTYYNWIKRGEANDPEYIQFFQLTNRAHNAAKIAMIESLYVASQRRTERTVTVKTYRETRLRKTAEGEEVPYTYEKQWETVTTTPMLGDWRAAESYLKRRHSDEWSERIEHTGEDGKPIVIAITKMDVDEL
jgi:transposase